MLQKQGYLLEERQPHMGGERHLTGPIGSGRKFLLLGQRVADGMKVVIKASNNKKGVEEIEHERVCRRVLADIPFAYQTFLSPKELGYFKENDYTVLVTEFIEQEQAFLERPIQEQFSLALKSFKAQESAHAATNSQVRAIRNTFGEMHGADYVKKFGTYRKEVAELAPNDTDLQATLLQTEAFLTKNSETIEQYAGFLTHWDFMPQNIRVVGGDIYLLDHSSMHFGNKYEGWARFINFMVLYNPPLARALIQYVRDNRTAEESLSLQLMRAYRLGELIRYYCGWLSRTESSLHELALARINFWHEVLQAVLNNTEVPGETVESYKKVRDALRSEEEKERQKKLH